MGDVMSDMQTLEWTQIGLPRPPLSAFSKVGMSLHTLYVLHHFSLPPYLEKLFHLSVIKEVTI